MNQIDGLEVFYEKTFSGLINRKKFYEKMDKGYKKEVFDGLKIKASVAEKFRKYSRILGQSQSMTLLLMLDFFEINGLSPTEDLGPTIKTLEAALKKRINALIAIIRDIEQQQTLPTIGMLEAIFQELPAQSKKKIAPSFEEAFKNLQRHSSSMPKPIPETDHKDIRKILRKIEEVKPHFGKPYWKVSLPRPEIIHLKSKNHVYHD